MRLPTSMMKILRKRRCLHKRDASKDEEILAKLTPVQIVQECSWHIFGNAGTVTTIAYWMTKTNTKPEDYIIQ